MAPRRRVAGLLACVSVCAVTSAAVTTTASAAPKPVADHHLMRVSALSPAPGVTSVVLSAAVPTHTFAASVPRGPLRVTVQASAACPVVLARVWETTRLVTQGRGSRSLSINGQVTSGRVFVRVSSAGCATRMRVTLTPVLTVARITSLSSAAVSVTPSTYPVTGTNVMRLADQLVAYTQLPGRVRTPTNEFGAEALVQSGVVTAVIDRLVTHQGPTTVPADGLVLSGHGAARDWLLRSLRVGTHVVLAAVVPKPAQLSGASGATAASGAFAAWRGSPVLIGGTWNDTADAQLNQWSVQPGHDWGSWTGELDVAVGAIYAGQGETWAQAAAGAYDARWSQGLTALRAAWGSRQGVLHIRFAHEFNGAWMPWAVHSGDITDFVTAWHRFRHMQRLILPMARLVFCPNEATSAELGIDWRSAFPGAADVDEMGVDTFDSVVGPETDAAFARRIAAVDARGAPAGIEGHRLFASQVGLPLAVPEWGAHSRFGDDPSFMRHMRGWFTSHAGSGAGQVPYEILFNVEADSGGAFAVYPTSAMPAAAAEYRALF